MTVVELLSEAVGTYLLVFTVGCNVITGTAAWAVTSIACVLMVSIYAFAKVSGSHFNPAVSVALALNSHLNKDEHHHHHHHHHHPVFTWRTAGQYVAAQLVGGILGAATYALMFWDVFNLAPAQGSNGLHAGLAELFYTFLLVFCVLNTVVSEKGSGEYFGLAIGFSVIAGGYGAGHISGGCFNPAVAIALDLSSMNVGFGWCLAYTLFELVGAALAVVVFRRMENTRDSGDGDSGVRDRNGRLLAEFIGTFFLVLTVGLNVLGGSKAPVWSIAASLMCVIYCMGDVSGGHFNPAVTLGITVAKRWPRGQQSDAGWYMGAQIMGGLIGAFIYSLMENGQVFALQPGVGHTWGSAYLAEFMFTFMLCYTVLGVACTGQKVGSFFALAIASCVTAGGCAIGAVSGGSLNPAVSIGISMSSIGRGFGIFHVFPYVLFELLAGAFAGFLFRFTHKHLVEKSN